WEITQGGLVWTFHLRPSLRWSDDRPITADDFRRAWLRALDPATGAPLAGPDLGIIRGARGYHATGKGEIGVKALDRQTLRVTLQHPVPWLDQLVAYPIAFPVPARGSAFSGPFRLALRRPTRLVRPRTARCRSRKRRAPCASRAPGRRRASEPPAWPRACARARPSSAASRSTWRFAPCRHSARCARSQARPRARGSTSCCSAGARRSSTPTTCSTSFPAGARSTSPAGATQATTR